jgi:epoxyqueuosine reductase
MITNFIQTEIGEVSGRAFVDSAPVLDKAWAAKSGLGWIGKNSNLLTKSRFILFYCRTHYRFRIRIRPPNN